jgi:hypothetical protein
VFHYNLGIVRADRGANHGSAAARPDNLPSIEARRRARILRSGSNRERN